MIPRAMYRLLCITRAVLPLLFALWLSAPISSAQVELKKLRVIEGEEHGRVEGGVRFISGDRHATKFNEYRDNTVGLYLQKLEVNFNNLADDRSFFNYQAREAFEKDQAHLLNTGMHGKFQVHLRWDEIPHAFSNTAKTIFVNAGNGVFTVPLILRTSLQSDRNNLDSVLETARPLDIRLRRATASGMFTYTPTPNWNIEVGYSRRKQSGSRPIGATINGFTFIAEQPEPTEYLTHTTKASAEYDAENWGFQVGYTGSIFDNRVGELVWDNAFDTERRGRIDLYPDNKANNLSISGALNLPAASRFMGSVVLGFMRQNDPFLPFTINSDIANIPTLPASSLHGDKDTLAMNYTFSNRAIPGLRLKARYQSYDYDNNTPSLIFPGYVGTDQSANSTVRRNLPYAYDKKNANFGAVWAPSTLYSLKVEYDWDRMDRVHRDVERSVENSVGGAFDFTPANWITFRASYRRSERDPEHYEANFEGEPEEEKSAQLEELRKFDEAARTRDRAESLLIVDPTDRLSLSAAFGTTQDDYRESNYGMLKNHDINVSLEASYALRSELVLFGEYTREVYRYTMRSRQRTPPTEETDTPNNDWESNFRDIVDTWTAGFDGDLFYHRLNYQAYYSLSAANGYIHTAALGDPTVPGYLPTSTENYPNPSNRFHQIVATVRFKWAYNLHPKFEYRFEQYNREDFQIAPMVPNMSFLDPGTDRSIFLGVNVPGYRVHSVAFAMEYQF